VEDDRAVLTQLLNKREAAEPPRAAAVAKVLAVQAAMRAAHEQRGRRREAVLLASAVKVGGDWDVFRDGCDHFGKRIMGGANSGGEYRDKGGSRRSPGRNVVLCTKRDYRYNVWYKIRTD
jgi:hypothetical protein